MKQVFARIWKDIRAYGLIVGVVVALWATCNLLFDTACLFVFLTGLPCPGCGMGHAFLALVTGNIVQAHLYNPSIWIWLLLGMCFVLYRYILGRQCKWMGWFLAAVAVLTVAIYLYRMVNLFPSEPPLTYYEGNLLRSWF